jgi:hypothetical protein
MTRAIPNKSTTTLSYRTPHKDPVNVVLVPIVTYDGTQDDTCILEPTECLGCAYIRHTSCIEYRKGNTTTLALLEAKIRNIIFFKKAPIGAAAVEKILTGAKDAADYSLPKKCSLVLSRQSLI